MRDTAVTAARALLARILADPTPPDLWELGQVLLGVEGEPAARARGVAREFHACLRSLESKSASRAASRWGALLGTGAIGSVSAIELLDRREGALHKLLQSGMPAVLEVGSALKSAEAWEVEARLLYDDLAWLLAGELWELSGANRPDLSPEERRDEIGTLLEPLLDPAAPDADRASLAVQVFLAVLAARLVPLLGDLGT